MVFSVTSMGSCAGGIGGGGGAGGGARVDEAAAAASEAAKVSCFSFIERLNASTILTASCSILSCSSAGLSLAAFLFLTDFDPQSTGFECRSGDSATVAVVAASFEAVDVAVDVATLTAGAETCCAGTVGDIAGEVPGVVSTACVGAAAGKDEDAEEEGAGEDKYELAMRRPRLLLMPQSSLRLRVITSVVFK